MDVERVRDNPFYVLELRPGCTRGAVEHQGQKLLGMLELELTEAATYRTPLGDRPRTAELVRRAMDELRDPLRRARHEPWATLPPQTLPPPAAERTDPWPDALQRLGW